MVSIEILQLQVALNDVLIKPIIPKAGSSGYFTGFILT